MGKSILGTLFSKVIEVIKENASTSSSSAASVSQPKAQYVDLSVEEWVAYFKGILETRFPEYTVKENVPVTELTGDVEETFQLYETRPYRAYKAEWGKDYDFVLYSDGKPKAVIMLGNGHCHSKHVDFLISRMFAKKLGVPYLGFYLEFPNTEDYVVRRIREQLD